MSSHSTMIIEFAKTTQNVSICLGVSILMIVLFMMTPLNSFLLSSIFGKAVILALLTYTIYYNTSKTIQFSKRFNISLFSGNWDVLKTNILCSYVFSFFLLVLILSVIRRIF
jgi:flagellar biosynthesis component FlhA